MPLKPPRSRRGPKIDGRGAPSDDDEASQGTVQHSTGSILSRGAGHHDESGSDDDPETERGTGARPALADRKKLKSVGAPVAVHRGSRGAGFDPERDAKTNTTMPAPDPSREQSGVSRSGASRSGKSQEWDAPPGKMSRELSQPEYQTGNNYSHEDDDDDRRSDPGYQTGNDYNPVVGEEEVSSEGRRLSLEGDGLDALDPEIDFPAHQPTQNVAAGSAGDEEDSIDEATNAGPPLKLEIVAGPDAGKRKKLKNVRFIIGRTPGVDLQLTDQSVSRRHVELVVGDGGVLLRDMGSGNGTRVNGEKVTEHILTHGDEIGIGKTRMKFVDEMGAIKKAQENAAESEAVRIAAEGGDGGAEAKSDGAAASGDAATDGSVVVAGDPAASEGEEKNIGTDQNNAPGAGGIGHGIPVQRGPSDQTGLKGLIARLAAMELNKKLLVGGSIALLALAVAALVVTRPGTPPPADPLKAMAVEKMQLARDAVRAERYEDAINLIDQAEKLVPGIDQTRLATQARSELSIVNALEDVKRLIEAKKFEDARAAIAKAPQGSVRTEEAKKRLTDQLIEAELAYKKEHFQQLIAQGELEAAAQAQTEMPTDMRREVQPVLDEARDLLAKSLREEQRQAASESASRAAKTAAQKAEAMVIAFAVVQRKFVGQEWARASAECDRVVDANPGDDDIRRRSKQLQNLIPNYGRNYEEGKKKFIAGQIVAAVKPLRKAWDLYQQIDFQSPMGEEIREKLAEASLSAGKDALLREDLGSAATDLREAIRLAPEDAKAKQLLQEVTSRADEVYQQAYMIRDRDPKEALKQFKIVVEITAPGSTVHEKAKNQISAMEP